MPTVELNRQWWSGYDWAKGGDEWSGAWGNPLRQWQVSFLPRIGTYLPRRHVLEIAPGFGRWTQFLLENTERYTGLDIAAPCIDACKRRFSAYRNARFVLNDGKSIPDAAEGSVDFVFSADSLVHADVEAVRGYIIQLGRILAVGGVGFIHHSNLGMYSADGIVHSPNDHARDPGMSAAKFRAFCDEAGLKCLSQELVSWGQIGFNDCFSLFARLGAGHPAAAQETVVWTNDRLDREQIIGRNYGSVV